MNHFAVLCLDNNPISIEQLRRELAPLSAKFDLHTADTIEDAQAALLGYNPNFRAYQQDQMADADFYKPKDIYEGQQNYDNPAARFFNGASDSKHRDMVRQQYER